jgi:hypothetical protein
MDRKLPEFLRPADVSLLPAQVHELTPEEQRERCSGRRELSKNPSLKFSAILRGNSKTPFVLLQKEFSA